MVAVPAGLVLPKSRPSAFAHFVISRWAVGGTTCATHAGVV